MTAPASLHPDTVAGLMARFRNSAHEAAGWLSFLFRDPAVFFYIPIRADLDGLDLEGAGRSLDGTLLS